MNLLLPSRIDTARCWLRPFAPEDLDRLYSLYRDPNVMATRKIGVQDRKQTEDQLREFVALWKTKGFGLYAVFERGSDVFVGECGFRTYTSDQPELIELSYGLRPIFWGGGIATEIASAMITVGFENFKTDSLTAHARYQNTASLRVLTKLGFVRCDARALGLPPDLARCQLSIEQWASHREVSQ